MAINFGSKNKEGVHEIPSNRTLLIEKLTDLSSLKPEMVYQLKNIEAVFKYFKPNVNVLFENLNGNISNETITFENLKDFDVRKIAQRSEYLTSLEYNKKVYFDIVNTFKKQGSLSKIIENEDSKAALLKIIKEIKKEIKDAN